MSSRERWTIYPLLFFSIGLALYNRVAFSTQVQTDVVKCDVIECRRVRVLGASGQEQAALNERGLIAHAVNVTTPAGESRMVLDTGATKAGQFQLLGGEGQRRVAFGSDEKNQVGEIAVFGTAPEIPLVLITGEAGGGTISTQSEAGKRQMILSHANGSGTLVSFDAEGKPHFYLTASLRPQATDPGEPDKPDAEASPPSDAPPPAQEPPGETQEATSAP